LLPIQSERGYLIPAINNTTVDYLGCAAYLARSIRQWHPDAKIAVVTQNHCDDSVFDYIVPLPYGDQSKDENKQINDWQMFAASPFRQTIKLEADMLATTPVDHWWTLYEHRDVVISQGCRDFYDQPGKSRFYRKIFDDNQLPDVFNAITYWRLSNTAKEFFGHVQNIFENWSEYKKILKFPDDEASTDVVYAMAAVIMGPEQVTLPLGLGPTIVHMKRHIIGTANSDWTQELVWELTDTGLRINTVAQWGFFHYQVKDWLQ
jgi:hypothetical protein